MSNDETVWIDVTETGRTTGASMRLILENGEEEWVPYSQMKARKKNAMGGLERIEVTRWWAEKVGLVDPKDDR